MSQADILAFLKRNPGEWFTAVKIRQWVYVNVQSKTVFENLKRLVKAKLIVKKAGYDKKSGRLTSYFRYEKKRRKK